MIPLSMFPQIGNFVLESIESNANQPMITIHIRTNCQSCRCPVCATKSEAIHSRYYRKISDISWSNQQVIFILNVKKFFCKQLGCNRKIFTERFEKEIKPYSRYTQRLRLQLGTLSLHFGAKPISRQQNLLGYNMSNSTLLKNSYKIETGYFQTPRVLGVDDWAIRKQACYGTILVDLEKRIPIGLLKDRKSTTLEKWLKAHPGVEIISRDRAGAYSKGAIAGAPKAIQIADRWHLLDNLLEGFQSWLEKQHELLQTVSRIHAEKKHQELLSSIEKVPSKPPSTKYGKIFLDVKQLQLEGFSATKIAITLGICRMTASRFMKFDTYPVKKRSSYIPSKVLPHKTLLLEMWQKGEKSPKRLWQILQKKGYVGSRKSVYDFIQKHIKPEKVIPVLVVPKRSAREVKTLLMTRWNNLKRDQQNYLTELMEFNSKIKAVRSLNFQFRSILLRNQPEKLNEWLSEARKMKIKYLSKFVRGIEYDYDAVKNAAIYEWSNGQVEGQVNKLKMIKRMCYGRASLSLLEKKMSIRNKDISKIAY